MTYLLLAFPMLLAVAAAQMLLVVPAEEAIEEGASRGEEVRRRELRRARVGFLVIGIGMAGLAIQAGFVAASVSSLLPRLFVIALGIVVPTGAVVYASVGVFFTRWLLVGTVQVPKPQEE